MKYSLRSLMIVVTLICVLLGGVMGIYYLRGGTPPRFSPTLQPPPRTRLTTSALSEPKVRVGLNREIWEASGNKEVSHEQEVYCSVDGEGTPNAA